MTVTDISEWTALNDVVYGIYTDRDNLSMRSEVLHRLHALIRFDGADFCLVDASGTLCSPVSVNCVTFPGQENAAYPGHRLMRTGKCLVYRDSDLKEKATGTQEKQYNAFLFENGWEYAMHVLLAKDNVCLGVLTLYRCTGRDDFSESELFIMDLLKSHLALRLSKDRAREEKSSRLTLAQCAGTYSLTPRESGVLGCLAAGKTNEDICTELHVAMNTLRKHTENIYHKMNVTSRAQLMAMVTCDA